MDTETKKYIAVRIREIRIGHHLSQEEFAAAFDAPRCKATVSSWENARTTPDADTLLEICRRYNASITSFYPVNKTGSPSGLLSDEEAEIINLYRQVPRRCQLATLNSLRTMAAGDDQNC